MILRHYENSIFSNHMVTMFYRMHLHHSDQSIAHRIHSLFRYRIVTILTSVLFIPCLWSCGNDSLPKDASNSNVNTETLDDYCETDPYAEAVAGERPNSVLQLIKQKRCFNCHQLITDNVGPSWANISKRYENAFEPHPKLVSSILNGSSHRYGVLTMPAQKGVVTEGEAAILTTWILNGAPEPVRPQSATELSSGLRMAIAKKCIDCHQYQSNQIAPTWNDIYVRQKDAFEPHPAMVKAILHGSVNRYGAMEMMPQSEIVSEAEAAVLATWILNGAH